MLYSLCIFVHLFIKKREWLCKCRCCVVCMAMIVHIPAQDFMLSGFGGTGSSAEGHTSELRCTQNAVSSEFFMAASELSADRRSCHREYSLLKRPNYRCGAEVSAGPVLYPTNAGRPVNSLGPVWLPTLAGQGEIHSGKKPRVGCRLDSARWRVNNVKGLSPR